MLKSLLNVSFLGDLFYFIYKQNIFKMIFVVAVLVIAAAVINATALFKKNRLCFGVNMGLFVFSLGVIVLLTITRKTSTSEFSLVPFYTFFRIKNGDNIELFRSFFMNLLLFIPIGFSMPHIISKRPHRQNVFITIVFSLILSAIIEFLQYYYHIGRCETDDVIANTLGAVVGTISYCLYLKIIKNQEKGRIMQKNIDNTFKLLLDLCAKSLFNKDFTVSGDVDYKKLLEESKKQTVFSIIYSIIKNKCEPSYDKIFSQIVAKNIRVEYAHNEVHQILSDNNIPYVILKGVASASYYNEPMLRMMGDVDILVSPDNISKADELLKSIGYVTDEDINDVNMHIGYKRKDGISCELHRKIGWVPNNSSGDIVKKYFCDIFEKSEEYKTSSGCCVVPCKFHHGLILLLHTATHLTHEGVGLRHLCDWAVFVNDFSSEEFVNTFEKPLKKMGLWRFARLLTLCSVKHLGCSLKEWAGNFDENIIDGIVSDILNGGNFGFKDTNRYSQIKYLNDGEKGTTSKRHPILQLFFSINTKTKNNFRFAKKYKVLLPVGWSITICKYLYMVIVGKRNIDTLTTITGAKQRKDIYDEFQLFKNDQY